MAADEGGQRYDCNDKCGESVVEELHGSVFVVVQFGLKRKEGLVRELDTAMALSLYVVGIFAGRISKVARTLSVLIDLDPLYTVCCSELPWRTVHPVTEAA